MLCKSPTVIIREFYLAFLTILLTVHWDKMHLHLLPDRLIIDPGVLNILIIALPVAMDSFKHFTAIA